MIRLSATDPYQPIAYPKISPTPEGWSDGVMPYQVHPIMGHKDFPIVYHGPKLASKTQEKMWARDTNYLSLNHLSRVYQPSNPDFESRLASLSWKPGQSLGYEFKIHHKPTGYGIGKINRQITFENSGKDTPFSAENFSMFIHPKFSGAGIANDVYNNQEEYLFKPLAGHPDSHVELTANGTVGRYAWAKKGFDFGRNTDRRNVMYSLAEFLHRRGLDPDEFLKSQTGKGLEELVKTGTPLDVAKLDDGNRYPIVRPNERSQKYMPWDDYPFANEIEDMKNFEPEKFNHYQEFFRMPEGGGYGEGHTGHLGKKFLIDHSPNWNGIKYLHPNPSSVPRRRWDLDDTMEALENLGIFR